MNIAYATRYLAAASVMACAGFGALGAVQALRYAPQLYRVGVPLGLTVPVARGAYVVGEPVQRWSVDAHVAVLKALPVSLRLAAIETYNPQMLAPKTQGPSSVGAKDWTAPAVLLQAGPVAPVAPARVARPSSTASLLNQPAVQAVPQPQQQPAHIPLPGRFDVDEAQQ
ncbi:hypothetical protein ACG04R_16485 [Roseateles sp. BYS78W]|uniref:Uncharacterized protein n=1 Tax=Pelomonas candidula TaxID=3299025 RepID=A0ABW7HED7_9BURK